MYSNNLTMQSYVAAVLRSTANSENLVIRPLAEYPPLTDAPLTSAEIDGARVVLVPLVLADACRQNPNLVVDDELINRVKASFTEERCRYFIQCAHAVRDQLRPIQPPLASGSASKRALEDAENLHGREKRARVEEMEEDANMEVDDEVEEGPVPSPATTTRRELLPPPEPVSLTARHHYDVFTPPAPSSVVSEPQNPAAEQDIPARPESVPRPEDEGLKTRPIVIEDDDDEEMDMVMSASSDDPPPPTFPTPDRSITPSKPAATPSTLEVIAPQRSTPAAENESNIEVPAPSTLFPIHTAEARDLSPPLTTGVPPPDSASPSTTQSASTPHAQEPEPDVAIIQDTSTMAASPSFEPCPPHELPRSLEPELTPITSLSAEKVDAKPAVAYATTPGLWGIDVGSRMSVTLDFEFIVSKVTHASVQRWSTRWNASSGGMDDGFISVRLLCLSLPQVQELDSQVRSGVLSHAAEDVATAIAALPVSWPDPGALLVLNGDQSFFADAFKSGVPLDISATVRPGVNTLRAMLIGAQSDKVYAVYAAPPDPKELHSFKDWRAKQNSFAMTAGQRRGEFTLGRTSRSAA